MASEVIDKLNKETISVVCETPSIISDVCPRGSVSQQGKGGKRKREENSNRNRIMKFP